MSRFVTGPGLIVPARSALLLGRALKVDELRKQIRGRDAEIDEVLMGWHLVSLAERERMSAEAGCDRATTVASESQPDGESTRRLWSSAQVAAVADVSAAAVTRAAREGRLPGRSDGGRWQFHEDDAVVYIEQVRRRRNGAR